MLMFTQILENVHGAMKSTFGSLKKISVDITIFLRMFNELIRSPVQNTWLCNEAAELDKFTNRQEMADY